LPAFRDSVDRALGFDPPRAGELGSWDDVKLLSVQVNRLKRWSRAGFLAIGDAAHAMSPMGGIGINLAVQDAIAAANLLAGPLSRGQADAAALARVQARREWPVKLMQRIQVAAQNGVIRPMIGGAAKMPFAFRVLGAVPWLRRLPTRMIGRGPRMERVAPAIVAGRPPD
jgi:2-polyprenyl-6-methoxyphenol hydroxylase-like FAD-dependent oxidoreductase